LDWTVDFDPRALAELQKLDRVTQKRVLKFLRERIAGHAKPRDLGKALVGEKARLWRYRVGDYRVICSVSDEQHRVQVLRIGHRKDVYR